MAAITTSVKRLLLSDLQTFLNHDATDGFYLKAERSYRLSVQIFRIIICACVSSAPN